MAMSNAPMTRDDLARSLAADGKTIEEFVKLASKLLADIQLTTRPAGDVTFGTLEAAKQVQEALPDFKTAVGNTRTNLKRRMTQRTKEV